MSSTRSDDEPTPVNADERRERLVFPAEHLDGAPARRTRRRSVLVLGAGAAGVLSSAAVIGVLLAQGAGSGVLDAACPASAVPVGQSVAALSTPPVASTMPSSSPESSAPDPRAAESMPFPDLTPVAGADGSAAPTTPSGQYAGVPVGTGVAYPIPDLVTSLAAVPAAPSGSWEVQDLGQYRLQPVVPGQACSSRPPFNVAGRQWSWYREGWASVSVTVTGWRTGRGPGAFDDVVRDAGICRFTGEQSEVETTVPGAAQAWIATSAQQNGVPVVHGAARVGDVVVGVEITDAGSQGVQQVKQLLEAVTSEMVSEGLPAATGA